MSTTELHSGKKNVNTQFGIQFEHVQCKKLQLSLTQQTSLWSSSHLLCCWMRSSSFQSRNYFSHFTTHFSFCNTLFSLLFISRELLLCFFHSCEALIFAQLLIINYGKSSMQAFMRCGEILLHLLLFLTSSFRFCWWPSGKINCHTQHTRLYLFLLRIAFFTIFHNSHTHFLFSWDKFEYFFLSVFTLKKELAR